MNTYRTEIDGLRAVAVIPVILFHAGFKGFGGGYVGVDIFFVISGYLISSMIIDGKESNDFSLISFYERRARRILPALFLVVFCSIPFAFMWMLPYQLKNFAQGLLSVVFSSSNILFWIKQGYFVESTELNPLVHTWSLAVEEQFYIFFPLTLLLLWRYGKPRMILVLAFLALLSLLAAQWSGNFQLTYPFVKKSFYWFSQHEWASFFLPTGRIWELLLGTFTAFFLRNHSIDHAYTKQIGALAGLVLILCPIVLFTKQTPFPSFYTLVPTMGAVLVIICADSKTYIGQMLSLSLFREIGLISYSAYLWHQPFLAFARLRYSTPLNPYISGGSCLLSLFLAYLSWRFVEKPFRNKEICPRPFLVKSIILAALTTILLALAVLFSDGTHYRSSQLQSYLINFESVETQLKYVHRRFDSLQATTFNSTLKKMAIIGDSFGMDFLNMAVENNKLSKFEIKTHYMNYLCQIYLGDDDKYLFIPPSMRRECDDEYDIRKGLPLMQQADVIIFAARWTIWSAKWLPITIQRLNLTKQNQKVMVLSSKNFGQITPLQYLNKTTEFRLAIRNRMDTDCVTANEHLRKGLNNSVLIDIPQTICTANYTCPIFTPSEKLISFDGEHLTKEGTIYLGQILFRNPLLSQLS